mmetsp:Transcript_5277/g.15615  ORF Transcript_5277/g.15615 Transcript_5277/m.15615 type:complete len:201 (-) Transcript_5277:155-757(-)
MTTATRIAESMNGLHAVPNRLSGCRTGNPLPFQITGLGRAIFLDASRASFWDDIDARLRAVSNLVSTPVSDFSTCSVSPSITTLARFGSPPPATVSSTPSSLAARGALNTTCPPFGRLHSCSGSTSGLHWMGRCGNGFFELRASSLSLFAQSRCWANSLRSASSSACTSCRTSVRSTASCLLISTRRRAAKSVCMFGDGS